MQEEDTDTMDETSDAISVAHAVGRTLGARGIDTVYGVVGSGNYEVTAALRASGARFVAARHEGAAVAMADAHHRTTGKIAAVSVHQGPGLSNGVTALGEAAKSSVPLLVLAGAAAATARRSNFLIDQPALVTAVGAGTETIAHADTAVSDTARAHQRAIEEQRPIVVHLPIDIQERRVRFRASAVPGARVVPRAVPEASAVAHAASRLARAERPVIVAGRGAWRSDAGRYLAQLGEALQAPLMTTAMALGLFRDHRLDRGVCGGFSSAAGADILARSDLILAVGASLTTWTLRGGAVLEGGTAVIRIDTDASSVDTGVASELLLQGDADATVAALVELLRRRRSTPEVPWDAETTSMGAGAAATPGPAASVGADGAAGTDGPAGPAGPAGPDGTDGTDGAAVPDRGTPAEPTPWVDAAAATAQLDALLPRERTLVVDGGHFIGWSVQGIRVPDPAGWVFTSAGFQSIGLGMGAAVGAAIARPDRLTVLGIGDGGYQMALSELETMVRLRLPVLVVVYNDAAYGAEVHHFGATDPHADQVRFPVVDIAAGARGAGASGATIRRLGDLARVSEWLSAPVGPLVLDLRVDPAIVGPWAEQDFLRH